MGNHSSSNWHQEIQKYPHNEKLVELYISLCDYGILNKDLFQKHFSLPNTPLASNLFERYFIDLLNSCAQTRLMFVERSHAILQNADNNSIENLQFYFDLIIDEKRDLDHHDLKVIVLNCIQVGITQADSMANTNMDFLINDYLLDGIASGCLNGASTVSRNDVISWLNSNCKNIFSGFQTWLQHKFTGLSQKGKFEMLSLPQECLTVNSLLTPAVLWYLCSVLPSCFTSLQNKFNVDSIDAESYLDYTWHILFDSNQHGLSLNRFKHKIMDYKSPTITFIQFSTGLTIVLGLDQRWTDSPEKFGGPYCYLIELFPCVNIVETNSNMVYLKEMGRSIPTGLIIGSGNRPKVKISIDLSTAEINYKGLLNETVERVEVWGCGGEAAIKNQADMKKWEQKEIEKRKKVKLPGQWDTDKVILEMAGVQVNHSQR